MYLSGHANELPGLVVSVMAFLAIFFLERILAERKQLELEIMQAGATEQQRIGRDLHDGIGQELSGIAYLAAALRDKLSERSAGEAEDASEIASLIRRSIIGTREIVKGLCPVPQQPDALANGLRELSDSIVEAHGIACNCECDPDITIADREAANHLYFIAREAAHNSAKHSKTDRITITLIEENGRVKLEVRDYGIGLAKSRQYSSGGYGLRIMNHRATLISGTLELRQHRDGGISIICNYDQAAD